LLSAPGHVSMVPTSLVRNRRANGSGVVPVPLEPLYGRNLAMTSTSVVDRQGSDVSPASLLDVCVDLAPGMRVRVDRCVGDVPMIEAITGRARLVVSVDTGEVTGLNAGHVVVAEEFAAAACAFRDLLRGLVSGVDM